jgi:hypothetical protein
MDNRLDLSVDCPFTEATGTCECDNAKAKAMVVILHVAKNTTRHEGYAKSINARRGIKTASRRCLVGSKHLADCASARFREPSWAQMLQRRGDIRLSRP